MGILWYGVASTCMRILLVNKFYFPQGGADKHVLQLERLLRDRGHEVAVFAMAHPNNQPSPWSKYFVSQVDFSRVRFNWQGLRAVGRMFYSFEAARKIEGLIREFKPDVVHLHNIYHQISPSILPVIAKHDIPIVQTLHDYDLISANYSLYAHSGICEHGRNGRVWEYVQHRCVKNSLVASLVAAIERWRLNRTKPYERYVGTFISPSQFLKDYILDWTRRPLPIHVLPNFTELVPHRVWPKDGSVLYLGRLSHEKGLATLLRSALQIDVPIKIVGAGPEEPSLKKLANELGVSNISWLGQKGGSELETLIGQAAVMVVPSEWYENNPLVVLEAFARGTPVVASHIGGLPELVRDGETGVLFPTGQPEKLAEAINAILTNPAVHERMSMNAVNAAAQHTPGGYLDTLLNIYASARTR